MRTQRICEETNRGQSFFHGAIILTIGMFVVKLIGALFKIPLNAIIGEYGMGLFSVAYHFYSPIHSLTIAGLPMAISKMVAENYSNGRYRDIRQIKSISYPIFLSLAITGTCILIFGAPIYCSKIIQNEYAALPMLVLAPSVFFGCLCSIYRGYFEGLKNMYPTAISEVIEALSKLLIGLSASYFLLNHLQSQYVKTGQVLGRIIPIADEAKLVILSYAAAAAVAGVSLGSVFSYLFMLIRYRAKGDGITAEMLARAPHPVNKRSMARRLIKTAIPVAIGSVTINVANLIDTTFLQSRLQYLVQTAPTQMLEKINHLIPGEYLRHPETIPNYLFGCYTLAVTIYMLVPTMTQAFSISALPNITSLWAKGQQNAIRRGISTVIRLSALFCFPAGIGIAALSDPIAILLYGDTLSSQIVGQALAILGIASSMTALCTPVGSIFQAIGKADLQVKLLLIAMAIKVTANYVLCGNPALHIYGGAIGTLICYTFLLGTQLFFLHRTLPLPLPYSEILLKPFFSALACGGGAYAISTFLSASLALQGKLLALVCTVSGVGMGALIFFLFSILLGCINKEDFSFLPWGKK